MNDCNDSSSALAVVILLVLHLGGLTFMKSFDNFDEILQAKAHLGKIFDGEMLI